MNLELREVNDDDLDCIATHLEFSDKEEIRKSLGVNPLEGLVMSIKASDVERIVVINGEPCGIFGYAKEQDVICPWAFFTSGMRKYPKTLVKKAKEFISGLEKMGLPLYGCVDDTNMRSIRWLSAIGFDFVPGSRIVNGYRFKEFFKCAIQ